MESCAHENDQFILHGDIVEKLEEHGSFLIRSYDEKVKSHSIRKCNLLMYIAVVIETRLSKLVEIICDSSTEHQFLTISRTFSNNLPKFIHKLAITE